MEVLSYPRWEPLLFGQEEKGAAVLYTFSHRCSNMFVPDTLDHWFRMIWVGSLPGRLTTVKPNVLLQATNYFASSGVLHQQERPVAYCINKSFLLMFTKTFLREAYSNNFCYCFGADRRRVRGLRDWFEVADGGMYYNTFSYEVYWSTDSASFGNGFSTSDYGLLDKLFKVQHGYLCSPIFVSSALPQGRLEILEGPYGLELSVDKEEPEKHRQPRKHVENEQGSRSDCSGFQMNVCFILPSYSYVLTRCIDPRNI